MGKDNVIQKAKSLVGKKAKLKNCNKVPTGTEEKKLHKDVKAGLEEHFSANLSKVRVHTGGNIKEICRELKAKAFTVDQNVYFMKSGDAKNPELVAHELTHVLNLYGGKIKKKSKQGKALVAKVKP